MKKILLLILFITTVAQSQTISIPDSNFKGVLLNASTSNTIATNSSHFPIKIDANGDGEIQLTEALQVYQLQIRGANIIDLAGIEYFANLANLDCSMNQLTSLSVLNTLPNLSVLTCNNNQLSALDISSLGTLTQLSCYNNALTSASLIFNNNLTFLNCSNNPLGNLDLVTLINLEVLQCNSNLLSNLDVTTLTNLQTLYCKSNSLTSLNVSTLTSLKNLDYSLNAVNTIDLSALINLEYLICSQNGITSLNVNSSPNLIELTCSQNEITSLNVLALTNLEKLQIQNNLISSIDFTGLNNLKTLSCNENLFSTLTVSSLTNLENLIYGNDGLANINVGNLTNLKTFYGHKLSQLPTNINNLQNLEELVIVISEMTEIDVSNLSSLNSFASYENPQLTYVNLKNGNNFTASGISFSANPNLMFVCVNDNDLNNVNSIGNDNGNFHLNSYCSFIPGGNYNTIKGAVLLNCDQDEKTVYNKVTINDGIEQGSTFTDQNGEYTFFTQTGTYIITPVVENSNFFTITPPIDAVIFADNNNNEETLNFCISPNGIHPDLEIVIAPIIPARPGFDAVYKIVYKNKGNTTLGQLYGINFFYDENVMDFVSTTYATSSTGSGSLSWDYADLKPFENRSFYVTLKVNGPTETPAVNIGDVLTLTASVLPAAGDENTFDNLFQFNQTVVGSYDPNDITCIQGEVVAPLYIGQYLHYVINFENTGTFQAENIVVKTEINPADFDISTLALLETSHNVTTRLKDNIVEFIFQAVNLDTGGHGNILLKIKTKSNLLPSDIVTNKADIYFDYNFPVETNFANTTFQVLSNSLVTIDNSIGIYPNPSRDIVNVKANSAINSIEIYDIQGRIIQTKIANETIELIDISNYTNGIYFLKIKTEIGQKVEKLVKE